MYGTDRQTFSSPTVNSDRYRLIVLQGAGTGPRVQVVDCERGTQLFDWQGYVARHLINSGELGVTPNGQCRCYGCDKHRVCHLALLAAAARMTLSSLPAAHRQVAETMLQYSDLHLSAAEIKGLIAVDNEYILPRQVEICLADLVDRNLIQRIAIDNRHVFYDVDTRPHKHVFDAEAGRIFDA